MSSSTYGEGNVDNLVRGLELRDKRILDIGSGLAGPAFHLAQTYGAFVVGIDIEPRHIEISARRAKERGLEARTEFLLVEPGPLKFPDQSFDLAISSGGFTHIEDKRSAMVELMGRANADHYLESWRTLVALCGKGELLQVYSRGRKPV